jgi:hypothetical protein
MPISRISVVLSTRTSAISVSVNVFVFLLKTFDDLVEGQFSGVICFQDTIFFGLLNTRSDHVPGVTGTDGRVKALDAGSKCVNSAALMAVSSVFFFFVAFYHLFVEAIEDEFQIVSINISCAAISDHDIGKLIKSGLLSDLISFVL